MVITKETAVPEFFEVTVPEVNLSTATLMTAAPHLGKQCELINNEFMLCRVEHDAKTCLELGKAVTRCTQQFFTKVKANCEHEFNQYAHCVDKSSTNYKPWVCRKTQRVFDACMKDKLKLERPHFGYFTRARVHKSESSDKPEPQPCPCDPLVPDATPRLPDDAPRTPPRFTSRFYWMTE